MNLPENWEEQLLDEMDRRFRLPKRDEESMVIDDTQIGVEFAIEWVKKNLKP